MRKEIINFDILKTINLDERIKVNIDKIIQDYSKALFIDNASIESKKIDIDFKNNNITINFDKIGTQSMPETLDNTEAACILAILYYLNKEYGTAIKINKFIETQKKPTLYDYDETIINVAKYLKSAFNMQLAPIKIINKKSTFNNLSRYILINEDLLNNATYQDWNGYDVDFSNIPFDINQIQMLIKKNTFLIPIIINDENCNIFSLCAEDVKACDKLQKAYDATLNYYNKSIKIRPEEGSLIGPENIEPIFLEQKKAIIKNIIAYFQSAYKCDVIEDKIISKYMDRDFHYKDIVIEILASNKWVRLDETAKIAMKNTIKNSITRGYTQMQVKRKKVIFNSLLDLHPMGRESVGISDRTRRTFVDFMNTISIFDSGEYSKVLIPSSVSNPFSKFFREKTKMPFKRDFVKPYKDSDMKKIKEFSINMKGDFVIEFLSNIERDEFIDKFTK